MPSTIQSGYNVYEGVSEGDYGKAAVNLALLGLNFTPFIKTGGLPSRLARVVPEEFANTTTLGAPGAADVFVADASELVGLNSSQIAQKLAMKNADGTYVTGPRRSFVDSRRGY